MNIVRIEGDRLVVEPQGMDKVWALRRRIDVPLAHVAGATYDPGAQDEPKGRKAPGTALPRKTAGTFYRDGERIFWNVGRRGRTVVVELREEHFARLVLSVEQPRELVSRINERVG